ncbi:uncharacterized protein N7515_009852 [Penicillium bovifimosum]|uniref:Uncharacterized protein n=1 Tax=Penicillium bovifimosum TaxID=126998 RepID=A0A9W9GIG8_9EURO|nr:uncharacterized protein N7515_009852 [Penicillium bovifimosum]KAJ5120464.1 hypothetical protein N7515_009852 [Penicillium bovifimosum]
MPALTALAALQQLTLGFGVFVLSTLLLQAITLTTSPGIGQHLNNPDHVTLVLDRIQALSDIVETLYKEINPESLDSNSLTSPFVDPRPGLQQLAKSIVTYLLMVTWISGLYLFVDGLDAIRSRALKVYLSSSMLATANMGLIVMLLFLPAKP